MLHELLLCAGVGKFRDIGLVGVDGKNRYRMGGSLPQRSGYSSVEAATCRDGRCPRYNILAWLLCAPSPEHEAGCPLDVVNTAIWDTCDRIPSIERT